MAHSLGDGQGCLPLLVLHVGEAKAHQHLRRLGLVCHGRPHERGGTFGVCLGWVGLLPDQKLHHAGGAALSSEHQRRPLADGLGDVWVGAVLQQHLARLQAALHGGHHQGADALLVDGVAFDAGLHTLFDHGYITVLGCLQEGRDDILVKPHDPQITAWRVNLGGKLCRDTHCYTEVGGALLHRCFCILVAKIVGDRSFRGEFLWLLLRGRKHWRKTTRQQRLDPLLGGVCEDNDIALDFGFATGDDDGLLQNFDTVVLLSEEAHTHGNVSLVAITSRRFSSLLPGNNLHVIGHALTSRHPGLLKRALSGWNGVGET
mmetsp:Transcript_131950/g.320675  ORF Transcript_131950/g.320675 Transcript_131950/m.320675 type:complete len:317 (+) Transcript_131950:112-1062(+)